MSDFTLKKTKMMYFICSFKFFLRTFSLRYLLSQENEETFSTNSQALIPIPDQAHTQFRLDPQ